MASPSQIKFNGLFEPIYGSEEAQDSLIEEEGKIQASADTTSPLSNNNVSTGDTALPDVSRTNTASTTVSEEASKDILSMDTLQLQEYLRSKECSQDTLEVVCQDKIVGKTFCAVVKSEEGQAFLQLDLGISKRTKRFELQAEVEACYNKQEEGRQRSGTPFSEKRCCSDFMNKLQPSKK